MSNRHDNLTDMEARLRQCAPHLRAPDLTRVDAACARIAAAAPCSPLRAPHTFIRPLLRLAACLLLMLGVALLMRPKPRPDDTRIPLPAFASFEDLKNLVAPSALKGSLTCEAEDLASDLADLTAVLNERTFAILF